MLIKKKNPEWFPSENKELKVGDVIDITNPQALILGGDAVAVDATGVEISSFELYGVLVKDEMSEFQEYMKMKKAETEKNRLEKERVELEAKLLKAKTETPTPAAPVTEVAPAVETPAPVVPVTPEPAKEEKVETPILYGKKK